MKAGQIALSALLLTLATFVADVLLLRIPIIRTGYWTFVPLAATLALAIFAVVRRRRWTTIVPGVLVVLLVGMYALTRLISTPNTPPTIAVGQTFPDWSLPDQQNRSVRI